MGNWSNNEPNPRNSSDCAQGLTCKLSSNHESESAKHYDRKRPRHTLPQYDEFNARLMWLTCTHTPPPRLASMSGSDSNAKVQTWDRDREQTGAQRPTKIRAVTDEADVRTISLDTVHISFIHKGALRTAYCNL